MCRKKKDATEGSEALKELSPGDVRCGDLEFGVLCR